MFARLGNLAVRRRRVLLLGTVVVLVVAAIVGPGVIDRLAGSGLDDPGSDSVRARAELDERFDTGFADLAFLLTVTDPSASVEANAVDEPAVRDAGLAFTAEIAALEGTDDVVSYWTAGTPPSMRSLDGERAVLLLRLPGDENDANREALSIRLVEEFESASRGPLTVAIGGRDAAFEQIGRHAERDLAIAEAIALPLTLLLLLIVFRSVVAALVPTLVGVATILGALLVLFLVTLVADVSIFALNLVTILGLGLSVDYSLLIVTRFREERDRGLTVDEAIRTTVRTAGRTVAFSGLTVAVSLSALLVFPLYFLRSFAYAGIGVVGFAVAVSVLAVPAALGALGDRIERGAIGPRRRRRHGISFWREQADRVVDRPWPYLLIGVIGLAALAVPFLGVQWGESDHRSLPPDDPVRQTTELLTTEFASVEANAFPIVALGSVEPPAITAHAIAVSRLDGVVRVDSATGSYLDGAPIVPPPPDQTERFLRDDATWFNVVPGVEPISPEAESLITQVRSVPTPFDEVLVGGGTASLVDTKDAILSRIPLAAALIFGATFVLLFLMFGSVVVPVKAIVLNLLSLGATFGVMIVVFQEGLGADLLGFTATGFTDISTPILIFGIAFGLSMDYEVFLLSRIKEEWDHSGRFHPGGNEDSIVEGIDKTGPLVSAAALLLTITFLATATSGLSFVKLFGLGLAVAVLVDAFIVRITIVPALMAVAGDRNWWAPAPLRRLHERFGLSESEPSIIDLRPSEPVVDVRADDEPTTEVRPPSRTVK